MTHSPEHTPAPRELITTALEDWWITTDPAAPFDPPTAADMALNYLASHGYTITPDTRLPVPYQPRNVPSCTAAATSALLAIAALTASTAALMHHAWGWALVGFFGSGILTHEFLKELAARRQVRLNF